jgi:hypothetical integral membrane protein (TIGR02206 family)
VPNPDATRRVRGMSSMQVGFIAFTFLAPVGLWLLSKKVQSPRLARGISLAFAAVLIIAYLLNLVWLAQNAMFSLRYMLPMQLCDWAAAAAVVALVTRKPMAFELAYFWGIAGTMQALFTPAVDLDMDLRTWCFFIIHSVIPGGVFWLMFEYGLRPRGGGMWKVLAWSEVYLVCALAANRMTGANFGFLASKPPQKTMLDLFPDSYWLYVAAINATAVLFFLVLDLPWMFRRKARGTADA